MMRSLLHFLAYMYVHVHVQMYIYTCTMYQGKIVHVHVNGAVMD